MIDEKEPTVLDFVKSIIMPWKGPIPKIPPLDLSDTTEETEKEINYDSIEEQPKGSLGISDFISLIGFTLFKKMPWMALISLILAVTAQFMLEPSFRSNDSILGKIVPQLFDIRPEYHYVILPIIIYFISAILLIFSIVNKEWKAAIPQSEDPQPFSMRGYWLTFGICTPILLLISFLAFHFSGSEQTKSNEFNFINLAVWIIAAGIIIWLLWLPEKQKIINKVREYFSSLFENRHLKVTISLWSLLVLAVIGICIYFRFNQFVEVPKEMFSDQAEKLWDVGDILNGKYLIFFPRNTGREGLQMYLTALIAQIFGTGITFNSLKIGTVLAGLFTLPFLYLLGKELGNRWVGIFAMFLAGIAYWPNLISRIGLRFPFYPLFVAPALFYLFRGIRRSKRNDFILAGIALGIGLHGYSPIRILPFVIVIGIAIYLLHHSAKGKRWQTIAGLGIITVVSLVIFLPLLDYMLTNLDMFGLRAFSRIAQTERPYPAPVWLIFLGNLKNGFLMYFWDNGSIWVNSVPYRPALDFVSAALLFIGVIYLIVRYIQKQTWSDLFLLVSVPLLMMPSILSLAFPDENPALNRTSGAMVPIFIIAAIGLEGVLSTIVHQSTSKRMGKITAGIIGVILILISCGQNYKIMFTDFKNQYNQGAWNTTEIGQVIRGFTNSVGYEDTAYVIPFPHWVDTRLVGINAGYPDKDYAISADRLESTLQDNRTKLFIYFVRDQVTLPKLKKLYPNGMLTQHKSKIEGKDFNIYLVPGTSQ